VANFLSEPSPSNYFSLSYYFSSDEITSLTGDNDWQDRYADKIESLLAETEFVDDAQRYQYLDVRGYLASHNLIYMDKASMADSIEVRVPLLNHRFAGRYFNLPTDEKLSDGPKTPLKEHLFDILGSDFVGHDKQGFSFPIEEYLEEDLHAELDQMLTDDRFAEVVDITVAQELVQDHFEGRADNAMKIWALYTLWLWLDTFDITVE
jgi:asparagine synthase (glutamine-hydrolysing)